MSAAIDGGEPVAVHGMPLICRHCGGGSFARLREPIRGLAGADGSVAPVIAFACDACGQVTLFLETVRVPGPSDRFACLECGMLIPAEMETCVACGWSYRTTAVEEPEDLAPVADDACLACGAHFPPEAVSCPECDWTFEDQKSSREPAPEEPPYSEPAPTPSVETCPGCGAPHDGEGSICRSCGRILD